METLKCSDFHPSLGHTFEMFALFVSLLPEICEDVVDDKLLIPVEMPGEAYDTIDL